MINSTSPTLPTTRLAGTVANPVAAASSSGDLLASFKDIFSVMMATNSASSSTANQSTGLGMSDMMAPLMLILLEKLMEQELSQTTPDSTSQTAGQLARPEPSGRPVGGTLTQEFHPGHNGLDFGIPVGTPVKSTMDGQVVYAGWNNQGYGNLVIVENGDYRTYYAHLSSIPVSIGETVSAGNVIGLSGNTGNSTGPHLHYEIRKNHVPINPTSATLGTAA